MKYYYIKALSYDMELCESIVQAQNRTIAQNKIVFLRNEKIKELYVREFEPYQTSLEYIEKQLYLFEKTIENCLDILLIPQEDRTEFSEFVSGNLAFMELVDETTPINMVISQFIGIENQYKSIMNKMLVVR